jgi:hypothetical protein
LKNLKKKGNEKKTNKQKTLIIIIINKINKKKICVIPNT